jgi:predicted RecB family nuclease
LREIGIRTIDDVANMDSEQVHRMLPDIKLKTLNRAKLQAESLLNGTHNIRNEINLPEVELELFFDIESDPLRAVDYLFGFLVRDGAGERYEYQIAESPEGEAEMWKNFLEWIELLPDNYSVYHFGTFEKARISALEFKYGGTDALNTFKHKLIDLNEIVKDKVVFPLYFYGIKDIGRYIGFHRNGDISGGGESVAVYEKWLSSGDKQELNKIIDYNKDDVIATRKLKDWLKDENQKRFSEV